MRIKKSNKVLTIMGHCYSNQFDGIGILTKDEDGEYQPIPEQEFNCKFLFPHNRKLEEFFSTHPDTESKSFYGTI